MGGRRVGSMVWVDWTLIDSSLLLQDDYQPLLYI